MHNSGTKLELSLKSVIIGVILAILLCGANMYLGLKIGTTISASIPASIISLGILRLFRKYSILENNIAQTIASSGEALAGVFIFVFPALLILGVWNDFHYWESVYMGVCGGFIGIAYSVLLRKVLLDDPSLPFPEGKAIGKVLLATNDSQDKSSFKTILTGISISGIISFCQNGLQILASSYMKFIQVAGGGVIGLGFSFSPAALGAGFLIGSGSIAGFVGLILAWGVFLPYFIMSHGLHDSHDLIGSSYFTWKTYVRPIGIGVFLFGGVATILVMSKSIIRALRESMIALQNITHIDHSQRDLDIKKLMLLVIVCTIGIGLFTFRYFIKYNLCSVNMAIMYTLLLSLTVLVLGFVIASVAGYMVGMVGSSNSPLSGLYFIAVIILSLFLKPLANAHVGHNFLVIVGIIILLVGSIGFAAVITNENIQDYKSGQMIGATPYKQQLSLFIGVICSILLAPLMMNLIFNAYGIAGVVPHPGIDPNQTLNAPQASSIAMITNNVLHSSQDWSLLITGVIVGAITFIVDIIGKRTGKFRLPVLMLGFGLYLSPDLVSTLFIGGLFNMFMT
ncbi:MAG: hypothetical protein RLZZ293_1032, partial [Pseudomonadota bacterium]